MGVSSWELQTAIYNTLTNNANLGCTIYDFVKQDAAFPYVVIGYDIVVNQSTKTSAIEEYTLNIHTWDKNVSSRKSVKQLMDKIYAALHRQQGIINSYYTNGKIINCVLESAETMQEGTLTEGGDHYYHGIQRFKLLVQEYVS